MNDDAMPWISDDDLRELGALALAHDVDPEWLTAVMFNESLLDPRAFNRDKQGAVFAQGLIQFIPSTLRGMFKLSPEQIANFRNLSFAEQLPYVAKHLAWGEKVARSHMKSAAMYYQSVFLPATLARGSSPDVVIIRQEDGDAYTSNAGFDTAHKGYITVGDLAARIDGVRKTTAQKNPWREGLPPQNYPKFVKRLRSITGAPARKAWYGDAPPRGPLVAAFVVLGAVLSGAAVAGYAAYRVSQ